MNTKQIVPKKIESAFADNPEMMALIATTEDEQVQMVFNTMQAPVIASSIVMSSQDAVKQLDPETIKKGLAWNLESSMQVHPEALDLQLLADGELLCINIGSGALYFRLTDPAKRSLNEIALNAG